MKVSWKGRTFNQIISKMKKNTGVQNGSNIFMPTPVKSYRMEKEMEDNCSRATTSLADFFRPGATIVNSSSSAGIHTVDFNLVNNVTEKPCMQAFVQAFVQAFSPACSVADNAKRRMRSAGAPKQNYYTSSRQYLEKRNLGFEQNNYHNLRIGDSTFRDGIPSTLQNIYTPNGVNPRSKIEITGHNTEENPLFKYRWLNGNEYNVTVEDGKYDLEDLNQAFNAVQENNKHYLIDFQKNSTKVYCMKFVYDIASNTIQIQCLGIDSTIYNSERYSPWTSYLIKVDWSIPEYTTIPNIILLDNIFLEAIGFESPGYFPAAQINVEPPHAQPAEPDESADPANNAYVGKDKYYVNGTKAPKMTTRFEPVHYKPSNTGVNSSSVVTRLKYETITNATTEYTSHLGKAVGIALAYNIPAPGYSQKYLIGYPANCVPIVNTQKNEMKYCNNTNLRGV